MRNKYRRAELLARAKSADTLSRTEARALAKILNAGRGAPARDDLETFQQEFRRAMAFLIPYAQGAGYSGAMSQATDTAAISSRRIKGALKWFGDLSGDGIREWKTAIQEMIAFNRRVQEHGIGGLTPREVFITGCVVALIREFERTLSIEDRAAILVRNNDRIQHATDEVLVRTQAVLQGFVESEFCPRGQISPEQLANLIDKIASEQAVLLVQEMADFLHQE